MTACTVPNCHHCRPTPTALCAWSPGEGHPLCGQPVTREVGGVRGCDAHAPDPLQRLIGEAEAERTRAEGRARARVQGAAALVLDAAAEVATLTDAHGTVPISMARLTVLCTSLAKLHRAQSELDEARAALKEAA